MTTDCASAFAYLCGALTAYTTTPTGWIISTPAGWAAIATLIERGQP